MTAAFATEVSVAVYRAFTELAARLAVKLPDAAVSVTVTETPPATVPVLDKVVPVP